MSRVFLISTNTCHDPYPVFPLGMATVATALTEGGHEIRQFDWQVAGCAPEALAEALAAFGPDAVAVSIRNIDRVDSLAASNNGWELQSARDVIALVRAQVDVPIIVGGPAVSIMPRAVRAYVDADVAIAGEGERLLVEAVDAIARHEPIPEIWPVGSERLSGAGQCAPCYTPSLVSFYWNASGVIDSPGARACNSK